MAQFLGRQEGSVATLIGHLNFRHLLDRRSGFEQLLAVSNPDITVVHGKPYGSSATGFSDVLARLIADNPDLLGIYLSGSGQPEIYDAVRDIAPHLKFIGHEVTSCSRAALADGTMDCVVASDLDEIGCLAVQTATAEVAVKPPPSRVLVHVLENLPPVA